jgi:hypothetical protein
MDREFLAKTPICVYKSSGDLWDLEEGDIPIGGGGY